MKFLYHELPTSPLPEYGILAANVDEIKYFRAVANFEKDDGIPFFPGEENYTKKYAAVAELKDGRKITLRVGFENAADTWIYITKLIREINTEE